MVWESPQSIAAQHGNFMFLSLHYCALWHADYSTHCGTLAEATDVFLGWQPTGSSDGSSWRMVVSCCWGEDRQPPAPSEGSLAHLILNWAHNCAPPTRNPVSVNAPVPCTGDRAVFSNAAMPRGE